MKIICLLFLMNISVVFCQTGRVGINTSTPGNTLEINSGVVGTSGLRFTQLNAASTASSNPSNSILGLNNNGDVVLYSLPNNVPTFVSASSAYNASTPANTTLTLGEIQFRFDGLGGTGYATWGLSFRSSTNATLPVTCISHRESQNSGTYIGADFASATYTLNANTGAYTRIDTGGLSSNSLIVYTLLTDDGSVYKVWVSNRSNSRIYVWARRIR